MTAHPLLRGGPQLRAATQGDVDDLVSVEEACFGDGAWTSSQLRSSLAREHGLALALVGKQPGGGTEIMGSCVGWAVAGEAELERIAVLPGARRRGLGLRLLEAFVQASRDAEAETLFLEVRADNEPAIGLYLRSGFAPRGRRGAYYADGVDALLLALDLSAST